MNKITAHSLDLQPSQKLDLPIGARLLGVNVDHRFNKCLLWTLQDDELDTEPVTFTMAKLNEGAVGTYIGTFKDNSGYLHVFAQVPEKVAAPVKPVTTPKLAKVEPVGAGV
jgi:hypothetical protein